MAISDLENKRQSYPDTDPNVARRASEMVETALRFCEGKTAYRGRDAIARALKLEAPQIHDYFRHSLFCQVADYLARLDSGVVGIYTHTYGEAEEEGEDRRCSVAAPLNLILHAHRKTAALSSVVASLDRGLLQRYRELVAPDGDKMGSLLDVQVADDRDVEEGLGFGVVLKSVYAKPIRIWPS